MGNPGIRAETLRIFKIVHTWTGLVAGLLLFLAFYAGAITVFREDIAEWQAMVPHRPTEAALQDVDPLVAKVVATYPEARRSVMVNLPDGHESSAEAVWYGPDGEPSYARRGSDGELLPGDAAPHRLSVVIDNLHRTAGIPGLAGEVLLGSIACIYGLALVSGVILYLPALRRDLFALRAGRNLKLWWQDAHNSIGVLSLPFHILFALTGAVMSLHDPMLAGMNTLIYGDQGRPMLMRTALAIDMPRPRGEAAPMLPVAELLAHAREHIPGLTPHHLIYVHPGDRAGFTVLMGDQEGVLGHTSRVVLSSVTGEMLAVEKAGERPTGMSALSSLAALHFGDYGGSPVAWIYFCLGMAGAFLFYSGNLLWLEARRKRRAQSSAWHHQALARLTVGFCLGCCLAISVLFVAARVPLIAQGGALLPSFWGSVVLALLWSAMRSPVLGARDLLAASAVASACIPVSTLMVAVTGNGGMPLSGVDLAALGGAVIFALLARQVARRARETAGGSVWDAPRPAMQGAGDSRPSEQAV